jgi:hypothetical protein
MPRIEPATAVANSPAEKLLSEIVRIVYCNANHWVTGSFQLLHGRVLRRVRC